MNTVGVFQTTAVKNRSAQLSIQCIGTLQMESFPIALLTVTGLLWLFGFLALSSSSTQLKLWWFWWSFCSQSKFFISTGPSCVFQKQDPLKLSDTYDINPCTVLFIKFK